MCERSVCRQAPFHNCRLQADLLISGFAWLQVKGNGIADFAKGINMGCELQPNDPPAGCQYATFAGGCFWGPELLFQRVEGVTGTSVGYAQGHMENPTYRDVCSGNTGHTEAVRVRLQDRMKKRRKQLAVVALHALHPVFDIDVNMDQL